MSTFFCQVDDGNDEGATVEAPDAEYAAEKHAARYYDDSAGECGDEQVISVRDEAGVVRVFDVTTDWSPSFHASERANREAT